MSYIEVKGTKYYRNFNSQTVNRWTSTDGQQQFTKKFTGSMINPLEQKSVTETIFKCAKDGIVTEVFGCQGKLCCSFCCQPVIVEIKK